LGKKASKISVLEATENKDLHLFWNREVKENRVKINDENDPEFSYDNVFKLIIHPRGLAGKLLRRKPKEIPVLIHRDGADQCVKLGENNLIDPLTNEESKRIVKRTIALGLAKFEPIGKMIAFIIILLLIGIFILQILMAMGIRIG